MTSAIKTIIKNKSDKCFRYSAYPRYQIALRPCGEVGDCTEIVGDIFSFMETRQEALSLVKLMFNGTVEISYVVDGLFTADKAEANSLVKHPDVAILVPEESKPVEKPAKPAKPSKPAEEPKQSEDKSEDKQEAQQPEEPKQDIEPASNPEEQTPEEKPTEPATPNEPTAGSEDNKQEAQQPAGNRRRNKNIKLG